jgi:cation transport regulator ChaB
MSKSKDQMKCEIRYAIRLCQRQSRFYKRIQKLGLFLTLIGGSATFSMLSASLPHWLSFAGAALLLCSGTALIVIRPTEKAALNDADVKKYQALLSKANSFDETALESAIEEARQGDTEEIESLRNVAFNDVMREINRDDQIIHLNPFEKIMGLSA